MVDVLVAAEESPCTAAYGRINHPAEVHQIHCKGVNYPWRCRGAAEFIHHIGLGQGWEVRVSLKHGSTWRVHGSRANTMSVRGNNVDSCIICNTTHVKVAKQVTGELQAIILALAVLDATHLSRLRPPRHTTREAHRHRLLVCGRSQPDVCGVEDEREEPGRLARALRARHLLLAVAGASVIREVRVSSGWLRA